MMSTAFILDIYRDFAATSYGQKLRRSIRFERYNLGHLSHDAWRQLLGPDVNNLEHMYVAYQLAERLIVQESLELNNDEETLILLAAIVHDQAESLTGDITYGDKTADDTITEQELFRAHVDDFAPRAPAATRSLIMNAVDEIVFDDTTKLGKIFTVIERIGYVETALKAYRESKTNPTLSSSTRKGLLWLTADVLHNQIEVLIPQPCAQTFLRNNLIISDAYANIPDDIFSLYGDKEAETHAQFKHAQETWLIWAKATR